MPELIRDDEKYACIGLKLTRCTAPADAVVLAPGLSATGVAPFTVPTRWSRRLGERDVPAITGATLYLLATRPTQAPGVHDLEVRALTRRVLRLYTALLIATPGIALRSSRLFAGAKQRGTVDVMTSAGYGAMYCTTGTPAHWGVTTRHLRNAAAIERGMRETHAVGDFDRMARANNAFRTALSSQELTVRLHQSVRALEGMVLPPAEASGTGKIFAHRVSLFTGKKHMPLVRALYTMRGRIEHLHGPTMAVLAVRPDLVSGGRTLDHLAFAAFVAENLVRMCLHRLYTRQKLAVRHG